MTMNMRDSFENMTLEELWTLFPITLYDHNPKWKEWAKSEVGLLRVKLENGDAYTGAKSEFVKRVVMLANDVSTK